MREKLSDKVLEENYKRVSEKIREAVLKSGYSGNSDFGNVRVMAVTKTVPPERIAAAHSLGISLFGENKAQEFTEKYPFFPKNSEIHFIGGLQKNKVKYIIDKVSLIESLDSAELAEEINRRFEQRASSVTTAIATAAMDALIEVNIGGEASKHGISPGELERFADRLLSFERIRLRGIMVIPPPAPTVNDGNGKYFEKSRRLFEDLKSRHKDFDILSMGMSDDYETAILCGSTLIRLGKALFGERKV